MRFVAGAAVVGLALASVQACKSHDRQAQQAAAQFELTRDRLLDQMSAKLVELDDKRVKLEQDLGARSAQLTIEARIALIDALAKLEQQRKDALRALDETKRSTPDRWDALKQRADDALAKVDRAYDAAAKQLRE